MATYYWVGGDGTWDATTTTSWASSSGGAGGAGVPTSADNVIFDSSSNVGDYSVTIGLSATPATCADLSISFPLVGVVTIISAATSVINVYGSLLVQSSTVFTSASGSLLNFLATSTGKTISTNSVAMGALGIVFNSAAGGWTLSTGLSTSSSVTVTSTASAGFNTNGLACSFGSLLSTGSVARTISLGSSAITLTGTVTVVNFFDATNLTFNAGTSTLTCSSASPFLRGGGQTFYNVTFSGTGSGTSTIQGSNTFNNLTQTSRSVGGQRIVSVDGDNTITGTLTLQTLGTPNATQRTVVWSSVIGTRRTITAAALSGMTDVDFRDIEGAGAASWTGTRIGNLLNNTGITFTTGVNKYWVLAAGGLWNSSSAWALTPGGAPAAANFPLAQDTINIDLTTVTTGSTITLSLSWQIPTIICTRASGSNTLILATTASPSLYGSWTSCSGMSFTGTSVFEFVGQGLTQTVTSAGISFTQSFNVSSVTGTVLLADAFTTSAVVSHVSGTLSLNNYTLTSSTFTAAGTLTKAISFSNGTFFITGSSWNTGTLTNLTTDASGTISMSSGANKTFIGGSRTWGKLLNSGAGALTITGTNTFMELGNSVSPTSFVFPASTTTSAYAYSINGTASNLVSLRSSSPGTTYTLVKL